MLRLKFNHLLNRRMFFSWCSTKLQKLLQAEPRAVPEKPGRLANHLDRFGGRAVFFVLCLLLLLQFGFKPLFALLGAIGLTLGLHLSLKKGRPRLILRRLKPNSAGTELMGDQVKKRPRRWLSQVLTGLVFVGIGWVWDGGWGLYFTIIGFINLILATALIVGERKGVVSDESIK
ncbi:MAG: hypothetical protein ACOX5W_04280 [Bacillota bacterium]|jgi:hypothetical protein